MVWSAFMTILAIGLFLFQVQLGNVSGIVTKPGGNEPLPGATVILSPAGLGANLAHPLARFHKMMGDSPFATSNLASIDSRFKAHSTEARHTDNASPTGPALS